jgi:hypothetical protein
MISRRVLLTASLAAFLPACATRPDFAGPADPKGIVLERDFQGRSYAKGVFTNRLTGAARGLTVVLDGRVRGDTLTLREAFTYSDGESDVKTWVFRRTGPGSYVGTREDVVGEATIRSEGSGVRLSYDVDLPTGSGPVRVHFEDVIERDARGLIVNRAIVSKLGVPIGDVDLVFARRPLK